MALVAGVMVAGVMVAGCSTGAPAKPGAPQSPSAKTTTSTSAAPQVMQFGQERPGKRGVIVVGTPVAFELPADPARGKDLTRGLRFEVTVRNTTQQALQAADFTFSATANGAPATLLTDQQKQIGDKLQADVLPGKEGKLGIVTALPVTPAEVTIKVVFEKTNPLYWTGTV